MKLWLLTPNGNLKRHDDPWWPPEGKAFGFVIRAGSKDHAREIAVKHCGKEGKAAWLLRAFSDCEKVPVGGNPEIIMRED